MTLATNKHLAVLRDYKRTMVANGMALMSFRWLFNDDNGLAYIGTVYAINHEQARAKAAHDLTMRQLRLSVGGK